MAFMLLSLATVAACSGPLGQWLWSESLLPPPDFPWLETVVVTAHILVHYRPQLPDLLAPDPLTLVGTLPF